MKNNKEERSKEWDWNEYAKRDYLTINVALSTSLRKKPLNIAKLCYTIHEAYKALMVSGIEFTEAERERYKDRLGCALETLIQMTTEKDEAEHKKMLISVDVLLDLGSVTDDFKAKLSEEGTKDHESIRRTLLDIQGEILRSIRLKDNHFDAEAEAIASARLMEVVYQIYRLFD